MNKRLKLARPVARGSMQSSSLLDDAFATITDHRAIWRSQIAVLGLAYCMALGEQVAGHAPPRHRQVLARDVGLWLARLGLGLTWRDVADQPGMSNSMLAKALARMERLEDGRDMGRDSLGIAFWTAVADAEAAANEVRMAVIDAVIADPAPAPSSKQDRP